MGQVVLGAREIAVNKTEWVDTFKYLEQCLAHSKYAGNVPIFSS